MIIEKLSILNFKNIEEAELTFSFKMNCLLGDNGMGKTNLLDALYYLSFTKNYTNLPDSQLIRHDCDFAVLQGFYTEADTAEEIYCGMKRGHKKSFKRNKKAYSLFSEHIGLIPVVMVSPIDSDLIQGGSDERRKFVDMLISQYDKDYLRALMHYNKALMQRNALLKAQVHPYPTPPHPPEDLGEVFDIWEEQMVETGTIIHEKRKAFIEGFLPVFAEYYSAISGDNEQVGLEYESQLNREGIAGQARNPSLFAQLLRERRQRDLLLGYSTAGIHKDDFNFLLDSHLIRKIGSQGQNKTYLIALKLAQFSFLVQHGSVVPIMLLDDLFDKLDAKRVAKIVELVAQPQFGQIFISDTNRKHLDEILEQMEYDYKLFQVTNGQFSEMP
ncbi:DNA replication/repair protein RecF [Candidatus Symbiothrix dinenymphae]|uniref:DNA replication/repair protein RecF n=1 Tax=Candidatus Symbiothrix dinenymphae TaxID=467085 RepID=UPI000703BA0B|nr:DNA replication and repair protein RecF [Candidatus Symbiothrix dinenymphae]